MNRGVGSIRRHPQRRQAKRAETCGDGVEPPGVEWTHAHPVHAARRRIVGLHGDLRQILTAQAGREALRGRGITKGADLQEDRGAPGSTARTSTGPLPGPISPSLAAAT